MTDRVTLTTDAASAFLAWLERPDDKALCAVMTHPGYQAVVQHSEIWSTAVTPADVVNAVAGRPSPMYGLNGVKDNANAVRSAIRYVEAHRGEIVALVEASLARIFSEDVAHPLALHCIVGYDWGIGLGGNAVINLNSSLYLDNFREIGYMLVHEATHVAYERIHGPMGLQGVKDPGGLRHLVCTLVQNEGLAVYSPLQARIDDGCLYNRDYRLLFDSAALAEKTASLRDLLSNLSEGYPGDDAAESMFSRLSQERLSYVVGCSTFMNLENRGGLRLVREAALWAPERFVAALVES